MIVQTINSNKKVDEKQNGNNTRYHLPNPRTDLIIISQDISTYSRTIYIPTIVGLIISNTNEINQMKLQSFPWESRINIWTYININNTSTVHIRN